MGWFDDVGGFFGDLFTGRWTGGQTNVVEDVQKDPWVLAAPAAVAAAPFLAPEIAAGGAALGDLFGGAAAAGTAAETAPALGFAGEAGAAGGTDLAGWLAAPGAGVGADATAAAPTALDTAAMGAPAGSFAPGTPDYLANTGLFPGYGTDAAPTALGTAETTSTASSFAGDAAKAGVGAGAGAAGAAGGGLLSDITKGLSSGIPAAAVAGGALLYNMKQGGTGPGTGGPTTPNQAALTTEAAKSSARTDAIVAESGPLRNYLESGTLPPSMKAEVDQAVKDEKTRIVSGYAERGMPTDPSMNTSLATDLARADRNGIELGTKLEAQLFQQGQSLLSTGLGQTGLTGNLYTTLANMDRTDVKNMNDAIANFAAALGNIGGGGGKTITIK